MVDQVKIHYPVVVAVLAVEEEVITLLVLEALLLELQTLAVAAVVLTMYKVELVEVVL